MKTKLLVLVLVLVLLVLGGCSKSFDPTNEIPSLAQVQAVYPAPADVKDTVGQLNVLVYKNPGRPGAMLVLYSRPDSCLMIDVAGDGTPELLFKPKTEVFRNCVTMQMKICRDWYPDEADEYWRCVTRGILQCSFGTEIASWLGLCD